ncbi:hypothetical protein ACU686_26310 [Yinghuangia aomiensis]
MADDVIVVVLGWDGASVNGTAVELPGGGGVDAYRAAALERVRTVAEVTRRPVTVELTGPDGGRQTLVVAPDGAVTDVDEPLDAPPAAPKEPAAGVVPPPRPVSAAAPPAPPAPAPPAVPAPVPSAGPAPLPALPMPDWMQRSAGASRAAADTAAERSAAAPPLPPASFPPPAPGAVASTRFPPPDTDDAADPGYVAVVPRTPGGRGGGGLAGDDHAIRGGRRHLGQASAARRALRGDLHRQRPLGGARVAVPDHRADGGARRGHGVGRQEGEGRTGGPGGTSGPSAPPTGAPGPGQLPVAAPPGWSRTAVWSVPVTAPAAKVPTVAAGASAAAVITPDRKLALLDPATGATRRSVPLPDGELRGVRLGLVDSRATALAHVGSKLVLVPADGSSDATVVDVPDGASVSVGGDAPLITSRTDSSVIASGKLVPLKLPPGSVAMAVDGQTAVAAASSGTWWRITAGQEAAAETTPAPPRPDAKVARVVGAGHGRVALVWTGPAADSVTVALHDAATGQMLASADAPAASVKSLAWVWGAGDKVAAIGPVVIDLATGKASVRTGLVPVVAFGTTVYGTVNGAAASVDAASDAAPSALPAGTPLPWGAHGAPAPHRCRHRFRRCVPVRAGTGVRWQRRHLTTTDDHNRRGITMNASMRARAAAAAVSASVAVAALAAGASAAAAETPKPPNPSLPPTGSAQPSLDVREAGASPFR